MKLSKFISLSVIALLIADVALAAKTSTDATKRMYYYRQRLSDSGHGLVLSNAFEPIRDENHSSKWAGFTNTQTLSYGLKMRKNYSLSVSSSWKYTDPSNGDRTNDWDTINATYKRTKLRWRWLKKMRLAGSLSTTLGAQAAGFKDGANEKGSISLNFSLSKGNISLSPYIEKYINDDDKMAGSNLYGYGVTIASGYDLSKHWSFSLTWLDYDMISKKGSDDDSSLATKAKFAYQKELNDFFTIGTAFTTALMEEGDGRLFVADIQDQIGFSFTVDMKLF